MRPRLMVADAAFTLFEIAIALAILAVAVTSIAILFPVGIRAQQLGRQRLYAANVALNLMDSWGQAGQANVNRQAEAEVMCENTAVHRAREDFERALTDTSMCPLPPEIAMRLDSDDDEIGRLIADGGRLYYPGPGLNVPQSLLVAVRGAPQQNALTNHPCLAWPYLDHVPGPPHAWELANWQLNQASWPGFAQFQALYQVFNSDDQAQTSPDAGLAASYLLHAQLLATAVAGALGMPTTAGASGIVPTLPTALPSAPWMRTDQQVFPHPAWIWALSHLSHAALCQTAPQVAAAPTPEVIAYARATADAAQAWAMRYVTTDPYDWGMAREATHQSGWDYPLLQFDLFPSAAHPLFTAASVTGDPAWSDDVSWRVVSCQPPARYGQARGYHGWNALIAPNQANIAASWGEPSHFTLTRRFAACERARQLLCFSVDWQAYEDFEELRAAPQDAGFGIFDSQGVQVGSEAYGLAYVERFAFFSDASRTSLAASEAYYMIFSAGEAAANTPERKAIVLGLYGADRNGNGRYDHGPVPRSTRMKATTVARFNFYDRILPFSIRG